MSRRGEILLAMFRTSRGRVYLWRFLPQVSATILSFQKLGLFL